MPALAAPTSPNPTSASREDCEWCSPRVHSPTGSQEKPSVVFDHIEKRVTYQPLTTGPAALIRLAPLSL